MSRFTYVGPWAEAEVVPAGRVVKHGESFDVPDEHDAALLDSDIFVPADDAQEG